VNNDGAAVFIEDVLAARLEGRRDHVLAKIDELVAGPTLQDAGQVVCTMAAASSATLAKRPGEDFYRFPSRLATTAGPARDVSAEDLSPWFRTYVQMAVAIANGDRDVAVALFVGYVARRRSNAARLVVTGLNSLAHMVTCPDCCPDELRWEP
jgi:hypothetical protein